MPVEIIVIISLIICGIAYPFYIKAMRKAKEKSNYNSRAVAAMRDGKSAAATLVSSYYNSSDAPEDSSSYSFHGTYEYSVDGKVYKTGFCFMDSPPPEVKVFYLPGNPKKCYGEGTATRKSKEKIGLISYFVIPFIGWYIIGKILQLFLGVANNS